MRATLMHGAGDVRVEDVPDAHLVEPSDALVRVTCAAICGSDLWPYKSMEPTDSGRRDCRANACMAAGTASTTSTAARAKPCVCRRQTARSSRCRHARRAAGRRGRRTDALAADAVRRDGDRPPRRRGGKGDARRSVAVVGDGAVGRGAIGRVGVPEHDTTPTSIAFWKNARGPVAPPRYAPTSTSCFPMCWKAGSSPAASSTAPDHSTRCRPGTAR